MTFIIRRAAHNDQRNRPGVSRRGSKRVFISVCRKPAQHGGISAMLAAYRGCQRQPSAWPMAGGGGGAVAAQAAASATFR